MTEYEKLKEIVADVADDVEKFDKGNKAAGTRVRVKMQAVKSAAQDVRLAVAAARTPDAT